MNTVYGTIVVLLACGLANAQADKCFDFEDGELPSTDPEIQYGSFLDLPEAKGFRVQNGMLIQTLIGHPLGPSAYNYKEYPLLGGDFTPALPLVIEARLRVTATTGLGGAWFGALDGENDYVISFSAEGLNTRLGGDKDHTLIAKTDVFEFHTYRIESPANDPSFDLFIDNEFVFSGPARILAGINAFRWGGGSFKGQTTGDAEWEHVSFSQIGGLPCPWDLDGSGQVSTADLLDLLGQWGSDPRGPPDFNGDGNVEMADLQELLANWGPCPK